MLRIGAPCGESWEAMRSDGEGARGARFCEACGKVVHDFTRVTERRALAMAAVLGSGGLCARLQVDADGTAVFAPEPAARPSSRHLPAAMAAAMTAASLSACAPGPAMTGLQAPEGDGRPATGLAAPVSVATGSNLAVDTAPPPAPVPDVDSDGDNIPDRLDACPSTSGPPNADPGKNGCFVGVIVQTQGDIQIRPVILFAYGAKSPLAESNAIIREVANVLADHPEIKAVEIVGHTSPDEVNGKALSLARATAVQAALVKLGVSADRLLPMGAGADWPVVPNDSKENRAKNRRLELRVVSKGDGSSI